MDKKLESLPVNSLKGESVYSLFDKDNHLSNWITSIGKPYEKLKPLFDSRKIMAEDLFDPQKRTAVFHKHNFTIEQRLKVAKAVDFILALLSKNPLSWNESETSDFLYTLGSDYWQSVWAMKEEGFTALRIMFPSLEDASTLEKVVPDITQRNKIVSTIEIFSKPKFWSCKSLQNFVRYLGKEFEPFAKLIESNTLTGRWLMSEKDEVIKQFIVSDKCRLRLYLELVKLGCKPKWTFDKEIQVSLLDKLITQERGESPSSALNSRRTDQNTTIKNMPTGNLKSPKSKKTPIFYSSLKNPKGESPTDPTQSIVSRAASAKNSEESSLIDKILAESINKRKETRLEKDVTRFASQIEASQGYADLLKLIEKWSQRLRKRLELDPSLFEMRRKPKSDTKHTESSKSPKSPVISAASPISAVQSTTIMPNITNPSVQYFRQQQEPIITPYNINTTYLQNAPSHFSPIYPQQYYNSPSFANPPPYNNISISNQQFMQPTVNQPRQGKRVDKLSGLDLGKLNVTVGLNLIDDIHHSIKNLNKPYNALILDETDFSFSANLCKTLQQRFKTLSLEGFKMTVTCKNDRECLFSKFSSKRQNLMALESHKASVNVLFEHDVNSFPNSAVSIYDSLIWIYPFSNLSTDSTDSEKEEFQSIFKNSLQKFPTLIKPSGKIWIYLCQNNADQLRMNELVKKSEFCFLGVEKCNFDELGDYECPNEHNHDCKSQSNVYVLVKKPRENKQF